VRKVSASGKGVYRFPDGVFSRHLAVTEIKPPARQHSSQFWRILSSGFLILFAKQETVNKKWIKFSRKTKGDEHASHPILDI
jgi:hypothetical protein